MLELLSPGDGGWGDELLYGLLLTIQLALAALVCGLALGLLFALAKLSSIKPLRWLAGGYDLIIRGTPEFLILLAVYYGSAAAISGLLGLAGIEVALETPKFAAATIGLAMIFASYASEVMRGAFLAAPPGQIEAAIAFGMSPSQSFRRVRLPQMWRYAIPGLGNLWMVLIKDTSLAAVIAYDDLLRQAKVAGENTREPLLFFLVAGALYLALTALSDVGRAKLETRARRGVDREDAEEKTA